MADVGAELPARSIRYLRTITFDHTDHDFERLLTAQRVFQSVGMFAVTRTGRSSLLAG